MNKKFLTVALIGGSLLAGYSYYARLKRTSSELEVFPNASIHSISWDGIVIRLDVLLKNPTSGNFSLKFPFLKLTYKGAVIGSSEPVNKNIKIPSFGQVKIEKILVTIPIISIFSVSSSILKAIQNKEQVMITATMMTTIDLGPVQIPFQESHEVTLKK